MKNTNLGRRIAALVLCLALIAGIYPNNIISIGMGTAQAESTATYGKVIVDKSNVRKEASTSAEFWFKLPLGWVSEITDTTVKNGDTWYKLKTYSPNTGSRWYVGYIHEECFTPLTADEQSAWVANPQQPDGSVAEDVDSSAGSIGTNTAITVLSSGTSSFGLINASGVNFRATMGGDSMMKFDSGTVVSLLEIPAAFTETDWFKVSYGSLTGYVQANFITVMTQEEAIAWAAANEEDAGDDPSSTLSPVAGYTIPDRILRDGDSGDDVKSVQTRLKDLGYDPGTADGKYGNATVAAITAFQKKNGLTQDGKCGINTTNILFSNTAVRADVTVTATATPAPTVGTVTGYIIPTRILREDDSGDDVKSVQTRLKELGYKPGTLDGKYGENTVDAVLAFQAKNSLTQDGKCGPKTISILFSTSALGAGATTPVSTPAPGVKGGYIKLTKANVNLRRQPGGDTIASLNKGLVLAYIGSPTTLKGYTWYYVKVDNKKVGYVRSDCVVETDASGNVITTPTQAPGATATPGEIVSTIGYVRTTTTNVNLRQQPAGLILERVKSKGTVLPLVGAPIISGKYTWYPVKNPVSGKVGYLRDDCVDPCDANGNDVTTVTTPKPGTDYIGYIMTTKGAVNLRRSIGGVTIDSISKKGTVLPMTGLSQVSGSYTWYPVEFDGRTGYIRGDVCKQLTQAQIDAYLAGKEIPDDKSTPAPSGLSSYLITTLAGVNLRQSASVDGKIAYTVPMNTVMGYNDKKTVSGIDWYKVIYNNTELWVRSYCVQIMTVQEYEAWLAAEQPTSTPQTETGQGYVTLTKGGVNLRRTPAGTIIGRLDKGVTLPYLEAPTSVGKYQWYKVKTAANVIGYVRSDTLKITDSNGNTITTPTQTPGSGKIEASYDTLRKGSTGDGVKALVTELKQQGYYTGSITSSYDTAVFEAVKAFQTAKGGLVVDGIAGSLTQHALFGTVPVGTNDGDLQYTLNPVEKSDWFTGSIQSIFARGKTAIVVDVKTGLAFNVKRWAGGSHADAEPLTATDTARMCKIYGVKNSQTIADNNLWQRRPIWVIVGGRTFCASMYGIPHNYPAGDTLPNNDFRGQFCIHFTNSKGHESGIVDTLHQAAIQEAYTKAPSRK